MQIRQLVVITFLVASLFTRVEMSLADGNNSELHSYDFSPYGACVFLASKTKKITRLGIVTTAGTAIGSQKDLRTLRKARKSLAAARSSKSSLPSSATRFIKLLESSASTDEFAQNCLGRKVYKTIAEKAARDSEYNQGQNIQSAGSTPKLSLIDVKTGKTIEEHNPIQEGAIINIANYPGGIALGAIADARNVSSVEFLVNDRLKRKERFPPYSLSGDFAGTYFPWNVTPGKYKVSVSVTDKKGNTQNSLVSFQLTSEPVSDSLAVESFSLLNGNTGRTIEGYAEIKDEMEIDLDKHGGSLALIANVRGDAGSVRFGLNENGTFRIDNKAPFSLGNESKSGFINLDLKPGVYAISAIPTDKRNANGTRGQAGYLLLTVTDRANPQTPDSTPIIPPTPTAEPTQTAPASPTIIPEDATPVPTFTPVAPKPTPPIVPPFTRGVCAPASGSVVAMDSTWLTAKGNGPYYLDQANTTYQLRAAELKTKGTAFVIMANNVTLDLCGNRVIYNDSEPVLIKNGEFDIYDGQGHAANWDFSNAPDAIVAAARPGAKYSNLAGNVAQINFPAAAQEILSDPFTLQANTTYSITAVVSRQGSDVDASSIYFGLAGTDVKKTYTSGNKVAYILPYKTGSQPETHRIVFGTTGDTDTGIATFDKVSVQQHTKVGVVVGPRSHNITRFYSDLVRTGQASNATIRNGEIKQGKDNGSASWPIFLTDDANIHKVVTDSRGVDTGAVYLYYSSAVIHDNIFLNDSQHTSNRHSFRGYLVQGYATVDFQNNTLIGGPQGGLVAGSNSVIKGNYFRHFNRYTNGFAIMLWGASNAHLSNNTIDCTGVDEDGRRADCRGLGFHRESAGTEAFDNLVQVQGQPQNDEYNGCELGGKYAVQFESGTTGGAKFHHNTVIALSDECDAVALRHNKGQGNGDQIYNNTFIARKISDRPNLLATTMKLGQHYTPDSIGTVKNNRFVTNHAWVTASEVSNLEIYNSHFEVIEDQYTLPYRIVTEGYKAGVHGIFGMKFIDSTFENAAARNDFETQGVRRWWDMDRGWWPDSWFTSSYTTKVTALNAAGQKLAGANIAIRNSSAQIVSSGTADASGAYYDRLTHFRMNTASSGGLKSDYNNHSASATYTGLSSFFNNILINRPIEIQLVLK